MEIEDRIDALNTNLLDNLNNNYLQIEKNIKDQREIKRERSIIGIELIELQRCVTSFIESYY